MLFLFVVLIIGAESISQNCTTAPCDLSCSGNEACSQTCSATPCTTTCTSQMSCNSQCPVGGCKKLSCDIDPALKRECALNCKENCDDVNCRSFSCRPECQGDNCRITCADAHCYPKCHGKNCELNCKAQNCEALCIGGGCRVRFGKGSSGLLSCPGGNCSFVCATGTTCIVNNNCPGCKGPVYVDDPFALASTTPKLSTSNGVTTPMTPISSGVCRSPSSLTLVALCMAFLIVVYRM